MAWRLTAPGRPRQRPEGEIGGSAAEGQLRGDMRGLAGQAGLAQGVGQVAQRVGAVGRGVVVLVPGDVDAVLRDVGLGWAMADWTGAATLGSIQLGLAGWGWVVGGSRRG